MNSPREVTLDQFYVLFNVFINDLGDGAGCTLSEFADDTELRGVADTLSVKLSGLCCYPGGPCKAEEWSDRDLLQFSKEKCKVLHLGRNNPRCQYMLGAYWLGSSFVEEKLRVLVGLKLNLSQQLCVPLPQRRLVIPQTITSSWREVI